jgi:hypothetical protein
MDIDSSYNVAAAGLSRDHGVTGTGGQYNIIALFDGSTS